MKAVVIGVVGEEAHESKVRDAFVLGYNDSGGNITSADVEIRSTPSLDVQGGFERCKEIGAKVLICSYAGFSGHLNAAQDNYPDVTLFMPTGRNEPGEIFSGKIPQVICLTGAGDTENETADNVEFIAPDPIESDEQDYSSYANGYVAGQILYIADALGCSIWEARFRAAATASEGGTWDEQNGYGFINVNDALAYEGEIPQEPFLPISLSITASASSVILGSEVTINWQTENALLVKLDGEEVSASGSVTFVPDETKTYVLEAENNSGTKTASVTIEVVEEIINNDGENMADKIFTGVIKEVELLKPNGEIYRSGLLTDSNLFIKAEPIKKRLSGEEATLGYDLSFGAEFAETDETIEDLERFNNETCTVLFDTEAGAENSLGLLQVQEGVFTTVVENTRINVHLEANIAEPGKTVLVMRGQKRVKDLFNNVFIFSEEKLNEIRSRYQTAVMDFNVYGDLDMNDVSENYDFNN